ncbi:MAG: ATP-binding protein [Gemmatimonadaceae bacterium]
MNTWFGRSHAARIAAVEAILGVNGTSRHSLVRSYAIAAAIAAGAIGIMSLRPSELTNSAFLVPTCGMVLQVLLNPELGPSLLVGASTVAAAEYYIVPLQGQLPLASPMDILRLVLVSLTAVVAAVFGAQRHRDSLTMRRQRGIMERLMETGGAPILVSSRAREIVFANQAAQRTLGLLPAADGGAGFILPSLVVSDANNHPLPMEEWASVVTLEQGRPQVGQRRRIQTADGTSRLYLVNSSPILHDNGQVAGVVTMLTDITELEGTTEALRKSTELWEHVSEAMPGTYFRFRVASDGSYNFDYLSPNFASLIGVPAARGRYDFAGVWKALHLDDVAHVAAGIDAAVRLRGPWTDEWRILLEDGRVRWMRGSSRPDAASPDGSQVWTGVFFDITQEKELEQRLLQAQKMESIGRLAGGIAHDFNNILTAIRGHADLALDALTEPHLVREELQEVRRATDRAAALTRQLLAFSRKQQLEISEFSLTQLLRDLEKMLRRVIGEDIALRVTTHAGAAIVRADRSQVEQVVLNLVVNARDAMPHGGQLSLETSVASIGAEAGTALDILPGDYLELAVADSGTGMDDATRARIFEPFFTTKPVGEGTGLGLAMVYGIVRQSGGAVLVDSTPGKGSTFRVMLPHVAAGSPVRPSAEDHAPSAGDQPVRVLVVEDETMVRALVERMLSEAGCDVQTQPSGDDALAWVRVNGIPFDVLLTDVVMPGVDGPTLARRLVEQRAGLRVVFMSGYSSATPETFELPGTPVVRLAKPFTRDALLAAVMTHSGQRQRIKA